MALKKRIGSGLGVCPLLLLLLAVICGCSDRGADPDAAPAVIEESRTDVDTLYLRLSQGGRKDVIAHANAFFHKLSDRQVTDSLIQFNTTASVAEVISRANYWMGEYLLAEERYREALASARTALENAASLGDEDLEAETHSLMSVIYFRLGLLDDAIDNLQFCYDHDSRSNDLKGMSSDLNNLAALSLQAKQYEDARGYVDRALQIERTLGRPEVLAIRLGMASETYVQLGLLDQAGEFAREAYRIDSGEGCECKAAIRLSQLASVLIRQGRDAEALQSLREAAPELKRCGNMYSYTVVLCQLGDLALKSGDSAGAARHYREALDIAEKEDTKYLQQRALRGLWESLKSADIRQAALYLEQYAQVTDSIYSGMTSSQFSEMRANFRQREMELERENLRAQMRVRNLIIVGGVVLLVVLLAVIVYILYSRRRLLTMERGLETQSADLLTLLAREHRSRREDGKNTAPVPTRDDGDFLAKLVEMVYSRLDEGESTDIDTLAHAMGMGRSAFTRKVHEVSGHTTTLYINKIKISKAKEMIDAGGDLSFSDVAYACGFEDPNYFSRTFKQIVGMSPTAYQNREKN